MQIQIHVDSALAITVVVPLCDATKRVLHGEVGRLFFADPSKTLHQPLRRGIVPRLGLFSQAGSLCHSVVA